MKCHYIQANRELKIPFMITKHWLNGYYLHSNCFLTVTSVPLNDLANPDF